MESERNGKMQDALNLGFSAGVSVAGRALGRSTTLRQWKRRNLL